MSTATLYNLVGPRDRLLGALLSHLFARLGEHLRPIEPGDPLAFADAVVSRSAALFREDAPLWRRVVHEVSGSYGARIAPFLESQPIHLMIGAMRRAQAAGQLAETARADAAALQVYGSYNGALFLWAGEAFGDEAFLNQARSGLWTVVAALGSAGTRRQALDVLASLDIALPKAWTP
jgi:AcrR family transcriptional regulator